MRERHRADGFNRGARLAVVEVALHCTVHMSLHFQYGRTPARPVGQLAVPPSFSSLHPHLSRLFRRRTRASSIHLPYLSIPVPHNFLSPLRNRCLSICCGLELGSILAHVVERRRSSVKPRGEKAHHSGGRSLFHAQFIVQWKPRLSRISFTLPSSSSACTIQYSLCAQEGRLT